MTQVLPPVAKSVFTFCKKCDADRYHTVLAHKTATSASVQCEVCGGKKTYTLPKEGGSTAKKSASPRKSSESARRSSHAAEYENLLSQHESAPVQNYTIKGNFEVLHKLQHPKFGLGLIRMAQPDKIEVIFADEVRMLIHNRS